VRIERMATGAPLGSRKDADIDARSLAEVKGRVVQIAFASRREKPPSAPEPPPAHRSL